VQFLDITYLLQIGKNAICIQACNADISRFGNTRQDDGLWCQINIDDSTTLAADTEWKAIHAEHLRPNQFRISPALGFTETQDLRKFTPNWLKVSQGQATESDQNTWGNAHIIREINQSELLPQQLPEYTSSLIPFKHINAKGVTQKASASLSVEFNQIANNPGTYVAHCFFYSEEEFQEKLFSHCDDSYKLFLNGQMINSQGGKQSLNGTDPNWQKPLTCLEGQEADAPCSGKVIQGWNSIIIVMYCDQNTSGITLNFGSIPTANITPVQAPAEEPQLGWLLAGPLKIPFSHISGMLNFDQMEQTPYHNLRPADPSAYLMSLNFSANSTSNEPVGFLELNTNDYVILDVGKYITGCPVITFSGHGGDSIDIIYGELCENGKLLPLHSSHGRKVDSIILSDEETEWSSQQPRAFRYLAIHIRESKESCFVKTPGIRVINTQEETKGAFSCNDETINCIYDIGTQTLESCSQYNFVNSPAGDNCQYIADAAIQGMASLQTTGSAELSKKSLIEFMLNQFETGEMPGACPSDFYFNIPDYPLHWVKWMQKHLLYTDDRELLESCMQGLTNLLDYYASLEITESGVLGSNLGELCFLDHADIDRRGIVTGLNALYSRALHSASWIFDYAGHEEAAADIREKANKIAETMRTLTWNEEKGLFADCYHDGKQSNSFTMQTNVLALYGALASSDNYTRVFDNIFFSEEPYFKLPTSNTLNPFFNYFILETAYSLNRRQWALNFTKWYWGGMVEEGASTWWEFYNPILKTKPNSNSSLCHGYGVSPNIYVYSELAGIRPAAPGFKQVYFSPLPGSVEWVRTHIPTPHGHIKVDWATNRDGGLDIEIKANYELDVISEMSAELSAVSTVHVSEDINIISELE
jgi:hypothetical protein